MRLDMRKVVGMVEIFWHNIWYQNISLAVQFSNLYQKAKFACSITVTEVWNLTLLSQYTFNFSQSNTIIWSLDFYWYFFPVNSLYMFINFCGIKISLAGSV
jgi:hypothetical protein